MHVFILARSAKHISSSILQAKKSSKSKRVRTIFTPEQLERLEAEFERQQYMVGPERLYLAHTLQLTEAQVRKIYKFSYSSIIKQLILEHLIYNNLLKYLIYSYYNQLQCKHVRTL